MVQQGVPRSQQNEYNLEEEYHLEALKAETLALRKFLSEAERVNSISNAKELYDQILPEWHEAPVQGCGTRLLAAPAFKMRSFLLLRPRLGGGFAPRAAKAVRGAAPRGIRMRRSASLGVSGGDERGHERAAIENTVCQAEAGRGGREDQAGKKGRRGWVVGRRAGMMTGFGVRQKRDAEGR
ncbi:hypothetical protein KFL_002650150 [Klebsormidium nitens]|uniref:Uncharacterized protein n=1 Tax=Klebsormidium nitens TaxID=105231 RepID=A0A1Y1I9B6_KLENI|nr:hypothetical protein KFL_002650150 [Klebsormidium nitens]|eukprot:GAQ86019.1 hypothetical protein KFL_002650150 [Klebsormidium nitens]